MKAKTVMVGDVATSWTAMYTTPPNTRAKLVCCMVDNATGSTVTGIGVRITDGVSVNIGAAKSLASGTQIHFLNSSNGYMMLEPGYTVDGIAASANISCIFTVEETSQIVSTS